ncbi:MAG: hypothetical protein ACRBBV_14530 [Paracoccaceae bacterium]
MAAQAGGFFRALPRHGVAFFRRGPRLVVTFDNMKSRDVRGPRFPWGYQWLLRRGDSHMGVMMARRNDWFRHGALFDFFDEMAAAGFFDGFDEVVFYGSSMGGYGALAFAAAAPNARVVALVPQTRLDLEWEPRFRRGFARGDWADRRYLDGAAAGARAVLVYDPMARLDRQHGARVSGAVSFCLPYAGHRVGRLLLQMGVLEPAMAGLIEGRMDLQGWRRMMRARHGNLAWCRALVAECLARDRPLLAQRVVDWIHAEQAGWHIPRLEREVRAARR